MYLIDDTIKKHLSSNRRKIQITKLVSMWKYLGVVVYMGFCKNIILQADIIGSVFSQPPAIRLNMSSLLAISTAQWINSKEQLTQMMLQA